MTIATNQAGSVLSGTVTFENDEARIGPLPIDEGRLSAGVATLTFRPASAGDALVNALGSAAPVTIMARLQGGESAGVTVRQDCPCLSITVLAKRLKIGV
jgi:hypothetical protein